MIENILVFFIIIFIPMTWECFIPNPYVGNKILSKHRNVTFLGMINI